jgi:hypothetical protein
VKRNFEVFDRLDFIDEIAQHIPDPGAQMGQEANGSLRHHADRNCATRLFSRASVAGKA